jgi:hypothetical protein
MLQPARESWDRRPERKSLLLYVAVSVLLVPVFLLLLRWLWRWLAG